MSFFDDPNENLQMLLGLGGESVVISPPEGATRTVTGVIERQPAASHYASPLVAQARMTITLVNSATLGISTAEYDAGGGWTALISYRLGGTAEEVSLTEYVTTDAGMSTFIIR